jgi:predicted HicB family RNase H-like nuclease
MIRVSTMTRDRLQAVADAKGISIRALVDKVLADYATEQIREILVRNGIKLD